MVELTLSLGLVILDGGACMEADMLADRKRRFFLLTRNTDCDQRPLAAFGVRVHLDAALAQSKLTEAR